MTNEDACYQRAVELLWCDSKDRTCEEIKKQLMEEFGVKTVSNMLRELNAELIKNV